VVVVVVVEHSPASLKVFCDAFDDRLRELLPLKRRFRRMRRSMPHVAYT
jgi:hypothetical protein